MQQAKCKSFAQIFYRNDSFSLLHLFIAVAKNSRYFGFLKPPDIALSGTSCKTRKQQKTLCNARNLGTHL